MIVRGWLMVGSASGGVMLPPQMYGGPHLGEPPAAASYEPGQWILWQAAPMQAQVTLVCVEVPLG